METLELVCSHFRTEKVIRVQPNGYNPKTGEYSVKGCWIKAEHWLKAIQILQQYEETGERKDIIFDDELKDLAP
jgi:hypothetical protein